MIVTMSIILVDPYSMYRVHVPLGSKRFTNLSSRIWNALSQKLNCNVSISLFKRNLKLFLLHNELVINYSKYLLGQLYVSWSNTSIFISFI